MNTYTTHWWITLAWLCIAATMQSIAQTTEPDAPIRGWGFDEFHIGGEEIYNPSIDDVLSLLMERVRKAGIGALIATHNMDLARKMDRILVMQGGELREI